MVSEITPLLIVVKLEEYDYTGATAIAASCWPGLRPAARDQRRAGPGPGGASAMADAALTARAYADRCERSRRPRAGR